MKKMPSLSLLAFLAQLLIAVALGGLLAYFLLDALAEETRLLEARVQHWRQTGLFQLAPKLTPDP